MKRIFIKVTALVILSQSQISFADPGLFFNVNATGSLLNLTTTIPHHSYANAGIKFNTPGYSLTSCRTTGNGFCLFSVSDTMPASLLVNGPRGMPSATLCLEGQGPLSCQDYAISITGSNAPRFIYISDSGAADLQQCSLDSTGAITSCTNVSIAPGSFPTTNVAFNKAGTLAYVGATDNVYVCNVDISTGNFSNCTATGSGFNFAASIALNPANTFAYVSSFSSSEVIKCSVDQTTGALSNCAATGSGFFEPTGITLNSTGTFAYVGTINAFSPLVLCAINPATGDFNSCQSASDYFFRAPTWAALNPLNTTAYVVNENTSVISQCRVSPTTGFIPGCTTTGDFAFNVPYNIEINSLGTTVYIGDGFTRVVKCSVDPVSGALSGCAVTGPNFSNLEGITLYS